MCRSITLPVWLQRRLAVMLDRADNRDVPLEPPRDQAAVGRRGFLRPLAQIALMALVLAGGWPAMQILAASKRERTPQGPSRRWSIRSTPAIARAPTTGRRSACTGRSTPAGASICAPPSAATWSRSIPIWSPGAASPRELFCCASIRLLYEGALVEARANLASTRAAIAEIDARLASEREQLAGCPGPAGTGQRRSGSGSVACGVRRVDRQGGR
jgi:hypothetical protein